MAAERFEDTGQAARDFIDEVLVTCPRCGQCAVSRPRDSGTTDPFAARRLTCAGCTYIAERDDRRYAVGEGTDPHFHLSLWLQEPCCGRVLWAHNAEHLDFLAGFVGATLRERSRGEYGWSNRSLASRLPAWMTSAKHRGDVLKAIARLRERLPQPRD